MTLLRILCSIKQQGQILLFECLVSFPIIPDNHTGTTFDGQQE